MSETPPESSLYLVHIRFKTCYSSGNLAKIDNESHNHAEDETIKKLDIDVSLNVSKFETMHEMRPWSFNISLFARTLLFVWVSRNIEKAGCAEWLD